MTTQKEYNKLKSVTINKVVRNCGFVYQVGYYDPKNSGQIINEIVPHLADDGSLSLRCMSAGHTLIADIDAKYIASIHPVK